MMVPLLAVGGVLIIVAGVVLLQPDPGDPSVPAVPPTPGAPAPGTPATPAAGRADAPARAPSPRSQPTEQELREIGGRLQPLAKALLKLKEQIRQRRAKPSAPDEAPVRHPVTRDGIVAGIDSAKEDFIECYETWLEINPTLQGTLTISFRIEPDAEDPERGFVGDAHVKEGGLGNQFLDGCVVAAMSEMEFEAPPPEGLDVTYPLRFSTGDAPPR